MTYCCHWKDIQRLNFRREVLERKPMTRRPRVFQSIPQNDPKDNRV